MGLCDPNSSCNNTEGSFECTCNPGFNGDGIICIEGTSDRAPPPPPLPPPPCTTTFSPTLLCLLACRYVALKCLESSAQPTIDPGCGTFEHQCQALDFPSSLIVHPSFEESLPISFTY